MKSRLNQIGIWIVLVLRILPRAITLSIVFSCIINRFLLLAAVGSMFFIILVRNDWPDLKNCFKLFFRFWNLSEDEISGKLPAIKRDLYLYLYFIALGVVAYSVWYVTTK